MARFSPTGTRFENSSKVVKKRLGAVFGQARATAGPIAGSTEVIKSESAVF